jgi:hypothetical protein
MSTCPPEPEHGNTYRLRLLAEVESATAMMSLVRLSKDAETIRSLKQDACQSYRAALSLFIPAGLNPDEERDLWNRLGGIRQWLDRIGYSPG